MRRELLQFILIRITAMIVFSISVMALVIVLLAIGFE